MPNPAIKLVDARFHLDPCAARDQLEFDDDEFVVSHDGDGISVALAAGAAAANLGDESVTTAKLGPDAVTSAKLADNAVGTEHLQDGAVTAAELGSSAVTPAKLGAVASAASYVGMPIAVKFSFTANGTPGNSDDVALAFSDLPAGTTWEIYDCTCHVESGAAASATHQVFTAVGGGGTAVTTSFATTSNIMFRTSRAAVTSGVTNATTLQMRRTGGAAPSGTAGHIRFTLVRTA